MEKIQQKDAVLKFIREVLTERGVDVLSQISLRPLVTKEIKREVRNRLMAGLVNGVFVVNGKSAENPKKYCSGLISNYLKKDVRYN